ncbi:hypothetical protein AXF42_Ash017828 [Apostasia shenzhenica]|uniref:Uncharacterized protein n=1 Tax=Apostasia shenzhenica TaxID=1088818 RepID=A0A2I0A3W5_9ASPA|nr:hypothetical protein AXF42_Ash017828 [Apostasia shenzhenica]
MLELRGSATGSGEDQPLAMHPTSVPHLRPLVLRFPVNPRRSWIPTSAGFSGSQLLLVRSSGETAEPSPRTPKEAVAGLLGHRVEDLLKREENRPLLEGLKEASRRVERARMALADIVGQETEALRAKQLVIQLQSRESEIAETQKQILTAKAKVEEAKRAVSSNMDEENSEFLRDEAKTKQIERFESIKAASVSSLVGAFSSLPISMYEATSFTQLALHTVIVFLSTALFGVTYRYTIRRDLNNLHLKTGTSAAFGFIKGLAELEAGRPLELNIGSFLSHSIDGVVLISENMFVFLASAIALDFCFKMRFLSPFPMKE